MTPPPPLYGVGDILLDSEDPYEAHYIIEDIHTSNGYYFYKVNSFDLDFWESERRLKEWAVRVA